MFDRFLDPHHGQADATRSEVCIRCTSCNERCGWQADSIASEPCLTGSRRCSLMMQQALTLMPPHDLQADAACNSTPRGAPPAFLQPLAAVVQRCVDLNAAAGLSVRRRCCTGPALNALPALRQVASLATHLPKCPLLPSPEYIHNLSTCDRPTAARQRQHRSGPCSTASDRRRSASQRMSSASQSTPSAARCASSWRSPTWSERLRCAAVIENSLACTFADAASVPPCACRHLTAVCDSMVSLKAWHLLTLDFPM